MSSHEGSTCNGQQGHLREVSNVGGQVGEVGPFGLRVLFGDDVLPGYIGILTNQYEL